MKSQDRRHYAAGFTLIEVLIGMTLSLMVLSAVLSSYVFLGRNFARSLGVSSANQPNLESQGRRSLAYFEQDVRMAMGLSGTISDTELTLVVPTATGTKNITYIFNTAETEIAVYGVWILPKSLARIDRSTGTALTLHTNLRPLPLPEPQTPPAPRFDYYDTGGNSYASYTNYLRGIKQVSMTFSAQGGLAENGTQTQVYQVVSQRLILRNRRTP